MILHVLIFLSVGIGDRGHYPGAEKYNGGVF